MIANQIVDHLSVRRANSAASRTISRMLGAAFAFVLGAALAHAPAQAESGGGEGGPRENDVVIRSLQSGGAGPTARTRVQSRPARAQAPARQHVRRIEPHQQPAPVRSARRVAPPTPLAPRFDGSPDAGEIRFIRDEVLALLAPDAQADDLKELERKRGLTRIGEQPLSLLGAMLVRYRLAPEQTVSQAIAALQSDRRVAVAQPNYLFLLPQTAGGSGAAMSQYAIDNLHLRTAHQIATGTDVSVAVIDSLIDADHPYLKGAVSLQLNAFDAPLTTPHAHGTAVAGLIAARGGFVGAAPGAKIIAIAAFAQSSADSPASGTSWRIARGLEWAVASGARIVNLGFVGPQDPILSRVFSATAKGGVAIVVAAGEGGSTSSSFPASDKNVIAVTATDVDDKIDARAGGRAVLAAPGVDVLTIRPGGKYDVASGSSMAAAYAAGVAALILEKNSKAGPDDLLAMLRRSSRVVAGAPAASPGVIDAAGLEGTASAKLTP